MTCTRHENGAWRDADIRSAAAAHSSRCESVNSRLKVKTATRLISIAMRYKALRRSSDTVVAYEFRSLPATAQKKTSYRCSYVTGIQR